MAFIIKNTTRSINKLSESINHVFFVIGCKPVAEVSIVFIYYYHVVCDFRLFQFISSFFRIKGNCCIRLTFENKESLVIFVYFTGPISTFQLPLYP